MKVAARCDPVSRQIKTLPEQFPPLIAAIDMQRWCADFVFRRGRRRQPDSGFQKLFQLRTTPGAWRSDRIFCFGALHCRRNARIPVLQRLVYRGARLFHPLRFDFGIISPNGTLIGGSPSPVITWEFPALAKYRFRWRSWSPFLEAGPSFRTAGNLNGSNPSHYGIAAGAGAEISLESSVSRPRSAISGGRRTTHWAPSLARIRSNY